MNPLTLIEAHAAELHALGASKIGVFGSFARGEETPESDVDIYLEFAEGMKTYDNFFAIYELLQNLFGRSIDLVTDGSLTERKARLILPTVHYAEINAGDFYNLTSNVAGMARSYVTNENNNHDHCHDCPCRINRSVTPGSDRTR